MEQLKDPEKDFDDDNNVEEESEETEEGFENEVI